ncbi:interleukin 17-like protein [Liolophura sinensis]|uniref:interleukin 17-like protein n=1 Tax=Liolophura sinensis TaxID=3198878 RepID=UPI003158C2D1
MDMIMIVIACLVSGLGAVFGAPVECKVPSNLTLQQQHNQVLASGGVLLPGTGSAQISPEFIIEHNLYGDSSCPSDAASGATDPLEERSICPWYGVINHDPTRYPATMVEAKCRCNKCINNNINQCEPVKYRFYILRQTSVCQDGYYVYTPEEIDISVGCTCAKPRSAAANPIDGDVPDFPF